MTVLHHEALRDAGVTDYTIEQCTEDYRRGILVLLTTEIMAITSLDPTNERGLALMDLILRRVSTAVADLDVLKLLPA